MLAAGSAHGGEHGGGHGPVAYWGIMFYLGLVVITLFGLMHFAKQGLNTRFFKNKLTASFEQLYYFIENLAVGIIGSHGRKYIPMVMVFWMIIFVSNIFALFFPTGPTADLGFNAALAIIAIMYVQWEGIRANGVFGHFSHFAGPKLGMALIPITGMIFIIELVSEMMKMVSLSLRLFGNIDGGHKAAEAMNALGESAYVPIGAFLMPIKLLTCVVQALIFSLLFCVYLSLVTHHDHDEHHDDHGHAGDGHDVAHQELQAAV